LQADLEEIRSHHRLASADEVVAFLVARYRSFQNVLPPPPPCESLAQLAALRAASFSSFFQPLSFHAPPFQNCNCNNGGNDGNNVARRERRERTSARKRRREDDDEPRQQQQQQPQQGALKRTTLPATVRNTVWNHYVGPHVSLSRCFVCKYEPITRANFHCGHVQAAARSGSEAIENLRPICALCNTSMGTRNLQEFMSTYHLERLLQEPRAPQQQEREKEQKKEEKEEEKENVVLPDSDDADTEPESFPRDPAPAQPPPIPHRRTRLLPSSPYF
jgi:hypothetical protein